MRRVSALCSVSTGENMKNKFAIILFFTFMFSSTTAFGATFKGRVIDASTKEPIGGAVVVASWSEERATPTGSTTRLNDVRETLTDKNGEWVIEGPRGKNMGNISAVFTLLTGTYITNPPLFIVFKPGYCPWPDGFGIDTCKGKIKPEGNDSIREGKAVELSRLSSKEDRLRALPGPVPGENALKKQKEFIKLINIESKNLGIPEAYQETN